MGRHIFKVNKGRLKKKQKNKNKWCRSALLGVTRRGVFEFPDVMIYQFHLDCSVNFQPKWPDITGRHFRKIYSVVLITENKLPSLN